MQNNNSTSRKPKLEYLHLFRGIAIQLLLLSLILMNICFLISNTFLNKPLSLLADYSFGIYFIHQYIINIFASISARLGFDYHNLLYSLIIFPVVIGTSVLIIFTVKKVVGNKMSRMLIGA